MRYSFILKNNNTQAKKSYTLENKIDKNLENIGMYFQDSSKLFFTSNEMRNIYNDCLQNKFIYKSTTIKKFINFLIKNNLILNILKLNFPNKKYVRFFTKAVTPYELALSVSNKAYLCNYTAAFVHGLTNNIPKIIYVNLEKYPEKERDNAKFIEQKDIDKAFYTPPRVSKNLISYKNFKINLLSGKYTNSLGVQEMDFKNTRIRITNIERTLIDLAVNPHYCGGAYEVLSIYKNAKGSYSPQKMSEILKKLNYIYPFHQAIGFYMEKAGNDEKDLKYFEENEMKYKFYLEREIDFSKRKFSKRWNLFYPEYL